ncbi:MAG: tetratricopeptide repeat protein [Chitinophagaceae bacterium]
MKHLVFLFCGMITVSFLFAQKKKEENLSGTSPENTYALVIGIANYENDRLNLNYANRDAQVFADYLMSGAGGVIPEDNIRLLIDTNATTGAIYNSLKWVKKRVEFNTIQDDKSKSLVYIYFSGHGDVETNTRARLGYLLAYNTPLNNYTNNAVSIEDLNDYAHTLSMDLNANVIIITDACHSGKLAGSSVRGGFLTGKELSLVKDREIRIASCNPDELSMEDERWGNGRGVFSWYLINGLKGLADKNNDNIVTLNEAQQYVDSSIANDAVLIELKHKQTPVLKGNPKFNLAAVNTLVLESTRAEANAAITSEAGPVFPWRTLKDSMESIPASDYTEINQAIPKEVPFVLIDKLKKLHWNIMDSSQVAEMEKNIRKDSVQLKNFTEKMIELLHSTGQQVINKYLEGDAAELEKRRYFSNNISSFDKYADMFTIAAKLVDPDDPLFHILTVNGQYFNGVALRLKLPFVNEAEQSKLVDQAIAIQLKALTMDDNAAYIHNELGVLLEKKKKYAEAEKYFIRATELAPSWALPQGNLCGLYAVTGKPVKAEEAGNEAIRLQPGLQITQNNLGTLNEATGNLLFAEQHFRQAIDINQRHYLPFERLGFVYLKTTKYELADFFFHEAEIRKKGYHFKRGALPLGDVDAAGLITEFFECPMDTQRLLKDDVMAFMYWGYKEYESREYANAERIYKKIIAVDPYNPLVFYYMGKIFYDQGKWEQAEIMHQFANTCFRDTISFNNYMDSALRKKVFPYDHACFEKTFRDLYFPRINNYFFLASLYDQWDHFTEAETWYRNSISEDPAFMGGYIELHQMMERQGRYTEAEKVIQSYRRYDEEKTDRGLNEFYRRATERFEDNFEWPYRLGILLYQRAEKPALKALMDTIIFFPKLNREVFVDEKIIKKLYNSEYALDKNETTIPVEKFGRRFDYEITSVTIPGIKKQVELPYRIYFPRADAFKYLLKADSLVVETQIKADINYKIGDVLNWSGSKKMAYPYYAKAVDLAPENISARMHLADVCKALYKHREGLQQLTYLYDSSKINFTHHMLYGEWSVLAGQFTKGDTLINSAKNMYPYALPAAEELSGRRYLLSKQPAKAIPYYKKYLQQLKKNASVSYSIAKLYAQTGNKTEALKWLGTALQTGFNNGYVLSMDSDWDAFRNNPQWIALVKKFAMRKYAEPEK